MLQTLLTASLANGFSYLPEILTFIAGGGISSLVSLKFVKQKARADVSTAVQVVYQGMIKDLTADKERMKEEMSELRTTCEQNSRDIESLKEQKCARKDCKTRI